MSKSASSPQGDLPPWGPAWCSETTSQSGVQQEVLAKFPPKCYFSDSLPFLSPGVKEEQQGGKKPAWGHRDQEPGAQKVKPPSTSFHALSWDGERGSRDPVMAGKTGFLRWGALVPTCPPLGPCLYQFPTASRVTIFESQSSVKSEFCASDHLLSLGSNPGGSLERP